MRRLLLTLPLIASATLLIEGVQLPNTETACAQPGCIEGLNAPPSGGAAWPQNKQVDVYVDTTKFTPEEIDCPEQAYRQVLQSLADDGEDTDGIRRPGNERGATGGPCEGTPGAYHYTVRNKHGEVVASLGVCICCEDNGGATEPELKTKCAILGEYW